MEHKFAALLRMAADNADQLFECDELGMRKILHVINYPLYSWQPVKTTKKIKKWLWCDSDGNVTSNMREYGNSMYPIKLSWSETEFEVEDGIRT